MKNLIIISFLLASTFCKAQIISFIWHGDTLWARNPLNTDSVQVSNKTVPWGSVTSKPEISGTNTGDQDLSGYSLTSHTHTFSSLTSKPTTLSGYGITDGVANTITVNGHALSGNVSVTASDLSLNNLSNNAQLTIANNLSDLNSASTARTNLGATTVGNNLFTLTNPSAVRFIRINADNTITARTAAEILSDINAQVAGTYATGSGSASGTNTGDNAVNSLYSGLVSNATHTGDATGSTGLTVVGINGTTLSGLGTGILKITTGTGVPSIAVQADITALLGTGSITNTMLSGSIAYSKLSLTGAILNADLAGSIAYSKLSLSGAILNGDLAGSIAASKLVGSDIATVGTIGTGTWQGSVINSTYGGTGVNNAGRTLTISTNSGTIAFGAASKTLTINNTLGLSGTDASTLNIGSGGTLGSNAFNSTSYQPLATNLTSIGALSNTSGYLNNNGSGTFSYVTPSGTGDMILGNTQSVTGAKTFSAGALISAANSTSNAAHVFTPSGASLKTSPVGGDMEVDASGVPYYTHATSERGVINAEQFITLTSSYTLTSQTAVQKIFNSTTNGQITLASNKTYYFECFFSLTALSSTSGSFGFALGGTAVLTRQAWYTNAIKAALATAGTAQGTYNTAANTTIVTANTTTTGWCRVWGKIVVGTGGTVIPQISLTQAAAAVVGNDAYFRIIEVGSNTIQSIGNWN